LPVKEKGKEKDATEINTAMKTFMVTKKIISERKSRIVIARGAEKAAIYAPACCCSVYCLDKKYMLK
jgi:hypothetical protein